MARRNSRKKQRNKATTILQTYNCYHVSAVIEGLYWGDLNPHDLPKNFSAYKTLAKFFQHGKPAVKKMLFYLMQTGFFDTLVKMDRWERIATIYENQYTGKQKSKKTHKWHWQQEGYEPEKFFLSNMQIKHLIRVAEILVAKGNYRWMDIQAFDFEQVGELPIDCLRRFLTEVFRIEVDAPIVLSCILNDDGLALFESMAGGDFTYRRLFPTLNKKEKDYFYNNTRATSLFEAYLMAILQGLDATEEEAYILASNMSKERYEAIKNSIRHKQQWLRVLPLIIRLHRKGVDITQRLMSYFAVFINYADQWIREPDDWDFDKVATGMRDFFVNLRDHLFLQYEVPKFLQPHLYCHWVVKNPEWNYRVACYLQIAQGGNVRHTKNLPVKLSKKEAHFFLQAPESATIEEAYRFAQVRAIGGTEKLAMQIGRFTRSVRIADEAFFKEVIGFLTRHFKEGGANMQEMLLYIRYQYSKQANYTLKGRTKESFLRTYKEFLTFVSKFAEENRRVIGQGSLPREFSHYEDLRVFFYNYMQKATWNKANIREFKYVREQAKEPTTYFAICQLHSADALRTEGKEMGHCVATYIAKSFQEFCLIFSLRQLKHGQTPFEEGTRMLTIEVRNRAIVQIKGPKNRSATKEEMKMVRKWAGEAKLRVA